MGIFLVHQRSPIGGNKLISRRDNQKTYGDLEAKRTTLDLVELNMGMKAPPPHWRSMTRLRVENQKETSI